MLKNYFPSNLRTIISSIIILFFTAISFSQQTATITSSSSDANWIVSFLNIGGTSLQWQATGPGINQSGSGDNPTFDFSPNVGNGNVTITIASNDNFDFVTELLASSRDIIDVDITNIENLINFEMPNNALTSINLSANTLVTDLALDNNSLGAIDLSTNTLLEQLELQNNNLITLDLSSNVELIELDVNNNDLTSINLTGNTNLTLLNLSSNTLVTLDISNNNLLSFINLDFNNLTTNSINQTVNDIDDYGTGNFGYVLRIQGNNGSIGADAVDSYNNLLSRNWTIVPPLFFDFGDAPNTYGTDRASGGPQHIIGDGDLIIGLIFDDEFDGFPGSNADGDDLDNVADEDGVNLNDLLGISTSTDNFSVDVDYTNNTSSTANLYGWIDFDGNGTFDADEYASAAVPNGRTGVVTLNWSNLIANGVDIKSGNSYARFRITTDTLNSNQSGGVANNGEVEDYTLFIEGDTDKDGVFDSSDDDADNDGILNTDEVGDTNGNGIDDMLELDADSDGCFDTHEAGVIDGDGDGIVGTGIASVDANGLVIRDENGSINSPIDAYGPLNDLDNNGVYDFQEVGVSASITTEPTDQDLISGVTTFSVIATADTYQWREDKQDGNGYINIVDAGDYADAATTDLKVTNSDDTKLKYKYRVIVNNIAFACDPTTTSLDVGYIIPEDSDIILEYSEFEENSTINELTKIFFINNIYTPHIFTLVDGNGSDDNDDFSISGDMLSKNIIFDYETKREYLIRIKAEDSLGFSMEKSFVIKVINVNDIVITGDVTNNTCTTGNSGSIDTYIDQVIPPLSFNWSSGETTQNISDKASGTYTFTVTDSEGMEKSKVFEIETLPIYNNLSICYVTSDDVETTNNRIYISNEGAYNIDKVEILRESNVQGQYDVIGEINPDEESYLDVTSDNETVSYNYKVRIKDNCGANSESSSLHKTILLQANKSADGSINLNWSAYEGVSYGTYDIYRKEKQNNGQFELLASISASNLSYNDTDANSNTKSYDYYIGINIPPCLFTVPNQANKSLLPPIVTIKSNIKIVESALGIDDEILSASLKIYPNPVADVLIVESKLQLKSIEIYNLLGQEIKLIESNFESINLNDLSRGIYMIKIHSENGSTVRKLIKQ